MNTLPIPRVDISLRSQRVKPDISIFIHGSSFRQIHQIQKPDKLLYWEDNLVYVSYAVVIRSLICCTPTLPSNIQFSSRSLTGTFPRVATNATLAF